MAGDLLNIGASGLRAYRSALSTVSDNVANANTEGFSRRTISLIEAPVSASTSLLYRPQVNFGGVNVGAISRSWDQFKAADARLSGTEYGEADARLRWLSTVETALDDGPAGIGTRLTAIFTSGDELAADPNGDFPRRAFLNAIDEAASAFRQTADDLARTADHIEAEATATTDLINADLQTLARINVQLRKAGLGTSSYAQIADERDRLLDEVASKLAINVSFDSFGSVRVTLAGGSDEVLVEDARAAMLGVQRASDGRIGYLLSNASGTTGFTPTSGSLAGLQSASEHLAGRRAELDAIATDFAAALNGWSAAGLDANGNPGVPLLSVTAGALSMQALVTDPDLVPAANSADGAFGNLLNLEAARSGSGAEDRWVALITSHGQAVKAARTNVDVTTARRDIAFAARDEISGVDLDQEAADLLRYQQAYTACARVVQVAREAMDEILNIL